MLLNLSSDHRQHLSFLHNIDDSVIEEFVMISLQFLTNGINQKIFKTAAQKLQADADDVKNAVIGLMHLFTEAAKHRLKEEDFYDSLIALGFRDSSASILKEVYSTSQKEARTVLNQCSPTLCSYDNLEWRLDVKLSTRALHQQITPVVRMKLHTSDGNSKETKVLQTDPVNLSHMTRVLEEALDELNTNHVRRILRNIT
ncbi:COMM domain-containing protein 2-like [Clavelina lepadiformis]|uniref:COMM domain-containing protein 2-like n=1 Tax=Clavelina lepadiformis TaxID=159417 RepID=UPI004041F5E0